MRKENINLPFKPFGPTNGEYYTISLNATQLKIKP
jgi:hypothetical protein